MIRLTLIVIMVCILTVPIVGRAQPSLDEQYRASLTMLISLLLEQIELLKAELATKNTTVVVTPTLQADSQTRNIMLSSDLMRSQFFEGPYTALYQTDGTELIPIDNTRTRRSHEELWERFVTLVGLSYARERIQEFRVYDDDYALYDAFNELDPRTGQWIIGFNTSELDLARESSWDEVDRLMLHEIGHMTLSEIPGIEQNFEDFFWDERDRAHAAAVAQISTVSSRDDSNYTYYISHQSDFVSEYAVTSPEEDLIESYVFYLSREIPIGNELRHQKVRFFDRYPALIKERERLEYILHR